MNGPPAVTEVGPPRDRVFRPQAASERRRTFWWRWVRGILFLWSPPSWHGWRRLLLRAFGARVDGTFSIEPSARVDFPWNLRAGSGVRVARGAILHCLGTIDLGDGAFIGPYAHLCAATHDHERRDMPILKCPITIGRDAWIDADAFVGPGVTVGEGCVLAPRSSAFRDLPAGAVCSGEPARQLVSRETQRSSLYPDT